MFVQKIVSRVALAAAFLLSMQSIAGAAPQVLGLVATLSPIPLACADGVCKAEFSSFCLQKERDVPNAKWRYEVAKENTLHLVLTDAQGRTQRMEAAPYLVIQAPRGFSAVEISMTTATLEALGAVAAAVEVGPDAALAPVARVGDHNPMPEAERLLASGPLRELGTRVVDRDSEVIATTRALNGLINALPDTVLVGEGARETLWQRAVETGFLARDSKDHAIARAAYDACWRNVPVAFGIETVRHCVQVRHDGVMLRKNLDYWKSVQVGS